MEKIKKNRNRHEDAQMLKIQAQMLKSLMCLNLQVRDGIIPCRSEIFILNINQQPYKSETAYVR